MDQLEPVLALIHNAEPILRKRLNLKRSGRDVNGCATEDICQITALKCIQYAQRRGVPPPSVAYVVKIGLNVRSDTARKSNPQELPEDEFAEAFSREIDPAEVIEREEELRLLRSTLTSMRVRDREIIQLHVLEEHPLDRIALDLGEAPDAVRTRFYRAMERLRAKMRKLLEPRSLR